MNDTPAMPRRAVPVVHHRRQFLRLAIAAAGWPGIAIARERVRIVGLLSALPMDDRLIIGVNPPGDNDFGENEVSGELADGSSISVKFNGTDKGCSWNIKVKWTGYSEQVFFEGLDLCVIAQVTLKYDRGTKKTTAYVQ